MLFYQLLDLDNSIQVALYFVLCHQTLMHVLVERLPLMLDRESSDQKLLQLSKIA